MEKQITLYKLDRFTRGVLVLIAIFLGILVFNPLLRTERVYVTNFPYQQQSVYVDGGEIDIRQDRTNPIYVEIIGSVDVKDIYPLRVKVTNFP